MPTNDFLPFAGGSGANVLTQADYAALTAILSNGFSSGVAPSQQVNKVLRQASITSAVLAQFAVDVTGKNAVDDGTTAALLAMLKSAISAQSIGVVGQSRNAKISTGTTATSTVTFTADEVIVESALGGLRYCLASVNKTINLASVGAGGMDTGTAPTSGFVGLYLIYNPITSASALLGVNATSAAAPEVYGGANMPSGYTASALVALLPTNASGQFPSGVYLRNRRVSFFGVNVLSTNTISAPYLPINMGSAVPRNATQCSGTLATVSTTNNTVQVITVAVDGGGGGARALSGPTIITPSGCSSSFSIDVVTPQTLYYSTVAAGSGTPTFTVNISNYEF
ncbi:hypothetical protein [Pandoraea communis]|uniref:hypothetical protein n=1 Tax=Pandoraea communis TaxID=2508297 RepID=UPI0025A5DBE6|nr:hypothetical protein [Pandoraea communis]MDM8357464.1 hypothetical protein [Pandoraea communis]